MKKIKSCRPHTEEVPAVHRSGESLFPLGEKSTLQMASIQAPSHILQELFPLPASASIFSASQLEMNYCPPQDKMWKALYQMCIQGRFDNDFLSKAGKQE
jgi:hypothetical protein